MRPQLHVVSVLAIGMLAGSAVGVAAQATPEELATYFETSDPGAAAFVTLEIGDAAAFVEDEETGIITTTGRPVEATDERVSGVLTLVDDYGGAEVDVDEEAGIDTSSTSAFLENAGGSWVGTGRGFGAITPETERLGTEFWMLHGQDGYEGLSLLIVLYAEEPRWGVIVPTEEVRENPTLPTG